MGAVVEREREKPSNCRWRFTLSLYVCIMCITILFKSCTRCAVLTHHGLKVVAEQWRRDEMAMASSLSSWLTPLRCERGFALCVVVNRQGCLPSVEESLSISAF